MDVPFDRPGDNCFEHSDCETGDAIIQRLQAGGKMKKPEEVDSRTAAFFREFPGTYLLYRIDSGEDSIIYLFHEEESGRHGLVKLFEAEYSPLEQLQKYRQFSRKVREDLPAINDAIGATAVLRGDRHDVLFDIVPIAEPIERNGIVAIFIEGPDWIRGNDGYASRCPIEPGNYGSMSTYDITNDEHGGKFFTIPYFKGTELTDFLDSTVTPLIRERTGANSFWVYKKNIKVQIDRSRKRLIMVITDLSDGIARTKFPEDL